MSDLQHQLEDLTILIERQIAHMEHQREQIATLRAANEAADEALEASVNLIAAAVEMMEPVQIMFWDGVRSWQEQQAPDALRLLRNAHAATEGGAA